MHSSIPPPLGRRSGGAQRVLELACGLAPFLFLVFILITSRYWLALAAVTMFIYAVAWLLRISGYAYRLTWSYYKYILSTHIDWQAQLSGLVGPGRSEEKPASGFLMAHTARWFRKFVAAGAPHADRLDPTQLLQAVIIATYTEPVGLLESTVAAIAASAYDHKKMVVVIAYEERGGRATFTGVEQILDKYHDSFALITAVKHPANIPGEAKAKAGNITHAARWLSSYCAQQKIQSSDVLVTTLDADNKPHRQYFAALAATYCLTRHRTHYAYQPLPFYTNNIWDVPAPVRLVAWVASRWWMMESMRPERIRLFSAYAQSLKTLEDADYWDVTAIVEDGHQYWRNYFTYHGDYGVVPLWMPVYQDAVQAGSYWRSLQAQFRQMLRWAWGASDTPYVVAQALRDGTITWRHKLTQISRQLDDYLTWSTAPLVLGVGGWLPWLFHSDSTHVVLAAAMLYVFAAVQVLAFLYTLVAICIYFALLPPRPTDRGRWVYVPMLAQWLLEPLVLTCFYSLVSLIAHARLILGKPLEKFDVTEKAAN